MLHRSQSARALIRIFRILANLGPPFPEQTLAGKHEAVNPLGKAIHQIQTGDVSPPQWVRFALPVFRSCEADSEP